MHVNKLGTMIRSVVQPEKLVSLKRKPHYSCLLKLVQYITNHMSCVGVSVVILFVIILPVVTYSLALITFRGYSLMT
jgi:hypothetical protein